MVYGTGFAVADDVVAHELGHGVIQNTAGASIYWFQSGAINESMADVIGELVDLADAAGNDAPEVRWLLGEDLRPGPAASPATWPPAAFGQPDHTASNLYDFAPDYDDNGGVHTNSGVPNEDRLPRRRRHGRQRAGAFNGAAFPGIGADKAALLTGPRCSR